MPPEAETLEASNPDSVAGWMKNLPAIEETETAAAPPPKKEEAASPPPAASAAAPATTAATTSGKDKEESAKTATESAPKSTKPSDESAKPDDEAEDKWPRSSDDWGKFKAKRKEKEAKLQAEIKAREDKLAEYDAKLKTIESELAATREKASSVNPESQAELERLKKQVDEYSQKLAVTAVTEHPKFVAYFKGKVDKEINLARNIVGAEKAEEVAKVLLMADGDYKTLKLEEIMQDITPLQSQRLTNRIDALQEIEMERATEIARANENRGKMQAEEQATAQKRAADGKKLFTDVLKTMQDPKDGMAIYQMRDGDEAWNAQVKATAAHAERLLFGHQDMKPTDLVKASLEAAAFPTLLKAYQSDMKQRDDMIAKLESQVKELSAAQPASGKGAPAVEAAVNPPARITTSTSPMEASRAWMKGLAPVE